jgi:hypothetical protein
MDQIFGSNMQKPMLGDASGLTDTMLDFIIDAVGAAGDLAALRVERFTGCAELCGTDTAVP